LFPICENLIINGIKAVGKSAKKVRYKLRRMKIRTVQDVQLGLKKKFDGQFSNAAHDIISKSLNSPSSVCSDKSKDSLKLKENYTQGASKKSNELREETMLSLHSTSQSTLTVDNQEECFEFDNSTDLKKDIDFTACFLNSHIGHKRENVFCSRSIYFYKNCSNVDDKFDSAFALSNIETSPELLTPHQKAKSTPFKNETPKNLFENDFLKSFSDQYPKSSLNCLSSSFSLEKKRLVHHSFNSDSLLTNEGNVLLSNLCVGFTTGFKETSLESAPGDKKFSPDYSQYDSEKVFGIRRQTNFSGSLLS